jgi:hypothetical protein
MSINDIWLCTSAEVWERALKSYWDFVPERNRCLEESIDPLDLQRLRRSDSERWYKFLMCKYFPWKYTDRRRLAATRLQLQRHEDDLGELDQIRKRLLKVDVGNASQALEVASAIRGLGIAGASGLLALMYPQKFGTVDQFVVLALREVDNLPDALALKRMYRNALTLRDGVTIVEILRQKADENNRVLKSEIWTPRKIDKVLWALGRRALGVTAAGAWDTSRPPRRY